MAKKKNTSKKTALNKINIQSSIEKLENGNVEITFAISKKIIEKEKEHVLDELKGTISVPGFRKGKAPKAKVEEKISRNEIVERILNHILPQALGKVIQEEKITPAVYPKFQLLETEEGKNWKVKAITCELPSVKLGDYEKKIKELSAKDKIWTPEKDKKEEKAEPTQAQKEQKVIEIIEDTTKVDIPELLINEETDARISKLLERVEKLGLELDNYLSSLGKTANEVREEYRNQALGSLKLDLALNKIAEKEKVEVSEKELEDVIKASSADPQASEKLNTPEQKRMIASVLRKRKALQKLTSLI